MKTGLTVAAVFIVGMFIFDRIMMIQVDHWAEQMVEISLTQRVLAGIAFMWHRFWWIGAPGIVGLFWTIGKITDGSESKKLTTT